MAVSEISISTGIKVKNALKITFRPLRHPLRRTNPNDPLLGPPPPAAAAAERSRSPRRSVSDPSVTLPVSGSSLSNSGFLIPNLHFTRSAVFSFDEFGGQRTHGVSPFPLASRFRSDGRRGRGLRIRRGTHEEAAEQRGEAAEAGGRRPCRGAAGQRLPSVTVGVVQERAEEAAVDFGRERHRPRREQP